MVSRAWRDPGPLGAIQVPTLYIWGDADDTVGRIAAEGTADFVAPIARSAPRRRPFRGRPEPRSRQRAIAATPRGLPA
jgi:pimeloyl-ACP methyl ester carboxylesterase